MTITPAAWSTEKGIVGVKISERGDSRVIVMTTGRRPSRLTRSAVLARSSSSNPRWIGAGTVRRQPVLSNVWYTTAARNGISSSSGEISMVRNGPSFVTHDPVIRAFGPNEGPIERPEPDDGRNGSRARDHSSSRPPMSVQTPARGAEAATLVNRSDPTTAIAMKIEPPRR